jgi:hypothetical protein
MRRLIAEEFAVMKSPNVCLREDTQNIKKISAFMIASGAEYLVSTLEEPLAQISVTKRRCEVLHYHFQFLPISLDN